MPGLLEPVNDEQGTVAEPEPWEYELLVPRLRALGNEIFLFQQCRPRLAAGANTLFDTARLEMAHAVTLTGMQHRRISRLERDWADSNELHARQIRDLSGNLDQVTEDLQGVITNLRKENAALIRAITRLA